MRRNVRAFLWDMLDASQFILGDIEGVTFEDYLSNRRLRQSVERSFTVIGEAARRLESADPQLANRIASLRQIVNFRNVLVHEYDEIQQSRVWKIINEFLPQFRDEIRELFESERDSAESDNDDPLREEPAILPLIEEHAEDIARLCEKFGVRKLELFGSACRGEYDSETSDLDFVAEFVDRQVPGYLDRYLGFADSIEALIGKSVDVVTSSSRMSPHFRKAVDECRVVVYEANGRVAAA